MFLTLCIFTQTNPTFEKNHGSRETRLETEFSASVGTPPPFRIQAQMQRLKRWEVSRSAHQQVVKDRKPHSLHPCFPCARPQVPNLLWVAARLEKILPLPSRAWNWYPVFLNHDVRQSHYACLPTLENRSKFDSDLDCWLGREKNSFVMPIGSLLLSHHISRLLCFLALASILALLLCMCVYRPRIFSVCFLG